MTEPLLSINEYVCNGSQTQFEISFAGGYISRDHVLAVVGSSIDADNNLVSPEDVVFTWVNDFTVSITPALAAGRILRIYRNTPFDAPVVDFTDQSVLSETTLDINAKQAVFLAAELRDRFGTAVDPAITAVYAARAEAAAADAIAAEDSATNAVTGIRADLASNASGKGASLIGNTGPGTGAIGRTVASSLNELPFSITGFGSVSGTGNKAGIIQAALDAAGASSGSREVVIRGNGLIYINSSLVVPSGVRLINDGNARLLPMTAGMFCFSNAGALPTAYTALTANGIVGTAQVSIASTAGYNIGDMVFLRSQALLPDTSIIEVTPGVYEGFNNTNEKIGQLFRIEGKTSTILYLSGALEYDYLVSDTAEIGLATGYTNLAFEGIKWGDPSHAIIGGRAINAKVIENIRVQGLDVWNRAIGGADSALGNGVLFEHVVHGLVEDITAVSGYYGVSVGGASRSVAVRRGTFHRNRHAISTNWNSGYGEPVDQLFEDLVCQASTLSSFDTHPVGRRMTFRKCSSIGAGDDGFQIRAVDVTLDDCSAERAFNDGIGHERRAVRLNVSKFKATENYRAGILSKDPSVTINDSEFRRNGQLRGGVTTVPGRCGLSLVGGTVSGGAIEDNDVQAFVLGVPIGLTGPHDFVFRNFSAPASARQITFCTTGNDPALDVGRISLSGVRIPGYNTGNLSYFVSTVSPAVVPNSPFRENTVLDASAPREGRATLVAGSATVNTAAFRTYAGVAGAFSRPAHESTVVLRHITNGGTPGALRVSGGVNATSFQIVSSSITDTSVVHWKIVD